MSRAVLSLGSNLGDRTAHLQAAVSALGRTVRAVSAIYRTPPWGGIEQDDFYNIVVLAEDGSVTDAHRWLDRCQQLEQAAGRERVVRWGPRTLDADVITVEVHGHQIRSDDEELTLPHPRAAERAFVLVPWVEVDPTAELPGAGTDRRIARRPGHRRDHPGRACALIRGCLISPFVHPWTAAVVEVNRMGFTRPRDLLAVALVSAVLAYLVVRLNYQRMPPLPRLAGLAAALVGIGEAAAGFGIRSRIRPRERGTVGVSTRKPVAPLTAARAVMAAKATSLAGAAVAGLWVGLLLYVLPSWSALAAAQVDGVTGIVGLVGAIVMIGGALFLEHCCRAPGVDR